MTTRSYRGLTEGGVGSLESDSSRDSKEDSRPRSDIQTILTKALGVRVEDLLGSARVAARGRPGPVGASRGPMDLRS